MTVVTFTGSKNSEHSGYFAVNFEFSVSVRNDEMQDCSPDIVI